MRNAMPVRWIEQKEARQVIATALFERAPKAPWSTAAEEAASQWLPRLGSWLSTRHPLGWAIPQTQPALARRAAGDRAARSRDDGDGTSCDW
jgi:hypothetical protein